MPRLPGPLLSLCPPLRGPYCPSCLSGWPCICAERPRVSAIAELLAPLDDMCSVHAGALLLAEFAAAGSVPPAARAALPVVPVWLPLHLHTHHKLQHDCCVHVAASPACLAEMACRAVDLHAPATGAHAMSMALSASALGGTGGSTSRMLMLPCPAGEAASRVRLPTRGTKGMFRDTRLHGEQWHGRHASLVRDIRLHGPWRHWRHGCHKSFGC